MNTLRSSKERGAGLIVMIIVTAFLLGVGILLLFVTGTGSAVAGNVRQQSRAFDAAEAGFDAAFEQLNANIIQNQTLTDFGLLYRTTFNGQPGLDDPSPNPANPNYYMRRTDEELWADLAADPAAAPAPARVVRVYYFHGNARCVSCRKIEALSSEAVRAAFPGEMKQGKVEWLAVNIEEPANRHFVRDYRLYTKSLVVVDLVDGAQVRWKNLERIWELLRNDEAFRQYVQGEVRSYLEKRS